MAEMSRSRKAHVMSETETRSNPRGIFDRTTRGKTLEPLEVEIERGRIRFFASVLGVTDPIHSDVSAARAAGYPDLVAPPSFFTVIDAAINEERQRRREPSAAELVNCDYRYLLHGDETYEYLGPIYAGDQVVVTTSVADFFDKKGGEMEFVTLVSEVAHADRGVLVRATRNLLHRLPGEA